MSGSRYVNISDREMVEHVITTYLKSIANAQIHLKQPNLNHICSNKICKRILIQNNLFIKRMRTFHCKMKYCRIRTDFQSIDITDNLCIAKVIVYETLKYNHINEETISKNTHEFDLSKVNNKWVIFSDKDSNLQLHGYNIYDKKQHKKYDKALEDQLNIFKKLLRQKLAYKDLNSYYNRINSDIDTLDREKMKLYQKENWNKRPETWGNFDDMGGDCTNYASQVIFAGGASMVYSGNYPWYYENLKNRSPAWTGVEPFYKFLIKNKTESVRGFELLSLEKLETGDIIQFDLNGDNIYSHTAVVYDPLGYMGILPTITSHSLDRFNEPILSVNYVNIRLIHLYKN